MKIYFLNYHLKNGFFSSYPGLHIFSIKIVPAIEIHLVPKCSLPKIPFKVACLPCLRLERHNKLPRIDFKNRKMFRTKTSAKLMRQKTQLHLKQTTKRQLRTSKLDCRVQLATETRVKENAETI